MSLFTGSIYVYFDYSKTVGMACLDPFYPSQSEMPNSMVPNLSSTAWRRQNAKHAVENHHCVPVSLKIQSSYAP